MWVNGSRIAAERAHRLRLGDSIKLGVAAAGAQVEHEYIFVRRPLKELEPHLAQVFSQSPKAVPVANTSKRKFSMDETEPSTSSKQKLYRGSMPNTSCALPGLAVEPTQKARPPSENTSLHAVKRQDTILISDDSNSPGDLDNLQMYVVAIVAMAIVLICSVLNPQPSGVARLTFWR